MLKKFKVFGLYRPDWIKSIPKELILILEEKKPGLYFYYDFSNKKINVFYVDSYFGDILEEVR